jgi:hypothetical protein
VAANDEEAFSAIRILARNDGISVEPATGVTFAGLFKMVQRASSSRMMWWSSTAPATRCRWKRRSWANNGSSPLICRSGRPQPVLPEEGLLSALEQVDSLVQAHCGGGRQQRRRPADPAHSGSAGQL